MKLGFFVTSQYLAHESMSEKIRENLEQVKAAKDAGFDLICTGEHYLSTPYRMATTVPLLGACPIFLGKMASAGVANKGVTG